MILWQKSVATKLPAVNEWHGADVINGRARIFDTTKYKKLKKALTFQFMTPRFLPIDFYCDMIIEVTMWKVRDTDGPVKAIMDALEDAGIVTNDKKIRDIMIPRDYHKRDDTDELRVTLITCEEELLRTLVDRRLKESP